MEIKEYGMIKMFLLRQEHLNAVPYRRIKLPLFIKMKNQTVALAGKVVELNKR